MVTKRHSVPKAWLAAATLAFGLLVGAAHAAGDPPDRVARVSYLRGNVSFQAAGDDQWVQMSLNRPVITGDRVYADRDSRAELEIGSAAMRLDEGTTVSLLNIDDNIAQLELTEGTLNLHVRRVFDGQSYEIDTPTLAFVVDRPGDYRVDIAPDGGSTMVTVFEGGGDVYGENNASYSVQSGNSYKFHDSALRDYEVFDLPRRDDFDQWCATRNDRYERSVSRRYVSEEVIGYADLDDYGSWNDEPTYGSVWYPTRVDVGWTPYRYGRWSWVDPWGWTWVDNSPWGFAPFHYGRWAYIGNRWGWCPGPSRVRPIYAPALVAFVGGSGWGVSVGFNSGPVGWFPLGPRDVYVPWYRASRDYFTNVNVRNTTIINNTYITNVYNNYSRGGPITNVNYAYRTNVNAVTAVPRNVFVGAGAVAGARVQVNEARLRDAQVVSRVGIVPERASFAGAGGRGAAAPVAALDRRVIARSTPPGQSAPIASRIQAIQRNDAQPLTRGQLRELPAARGNGPGAAGRGDVASRVQVVGQNERGTPQPLPMRGGGTPAQRAGGNGPDRGGNDRSVGAMPPSRGDAGNPGRGAGAVDARGGDVRAPARRGAADERSAPNATDRGALPSSRFAPHTGNRGEGNGTPPTRGNAAPPVRGSIEAPGRNASGTPSREVNTPNRSEDMRGSRNAPDVRTRGNTGDNGQPSNRFAPRTQPAEGNRPAPAQRTQPTDSPRAPAFNREAPSTRARDMSNPRGDSRETPQFQQRNVPAPAQRSTPSFQQRETAAPVQRSAPQQQFQRREAPAPVQRAAPQFQPREAPAPTQRSAPPQQMQRSAPPPAQHNAPQERRQAPPNRGRGNDDKDKDRH